MRKLLKLSLAFLMCLSLTGCQTNGESDNSKNTDVIIVGGGVSGMMSASEFARSYPDVSVTLMEKSANLGGNLKYTGGVIMGFQEDTYPEVADPQDFVDTFNNVNKESIENGFVEEGEFEVNEELILNAFSTYQKAVDFLFEIGVPFPETFVSWGNSVYSNFESICGGDDNGNNAITFNNVLSEYVENLDNVTVYKETEVTGLIVEDGAVKGVTYTQDGETKEMRSDYVILATGGIANNDELMEQYNPGYVGRIQYSTGLSHGDAILFTRQFNTPVVGRGALGGFVSNDSTWNPLNSYFMINDKGERFVNENNSVYVTAYAAYSQQIPTVYMICDQTYVDAHPEELALKLEEQTINQYDTIKELCEAEGIDYDTLSKTIHKYNEAVDQGVNPEFDLPVELANKVETGPFYIEKQYDYFFDVFTGIKVNENCQVVDENDEPVEGLYAVGQTILGNVLQVVYAQGGTGISYSMATGTWCADVIGNQINENKQ